MTYNSFRYIPVRASIIALFLVVVAINVLSLFVSYTHAASRVSTDEKLVTIHDRGQEKVVLTKAKSVREALNDAAITLDRHDAVEPKLNEELIGGSYSVNIYRARPVVVSDGLIREKIMTPYQTADKIAENAGVELHDEDKTTLRPTDDIVSEGAGVELVIDRAVPFSFVMYGKKTDAYTQAHTVGEMLKQKNVTLGSSDYVSVPLDTPMTAGMTVALWRNGTQTITEDQDIPFAIEKVYDMARPIGYHDIQTLGVAGSRTITYAITMSAGRETARKEIQNVVTKEAKKQVEVVGLNPGNGLSRSKGANMFTDSKGVTHRETYYDLPMSAVMASCGGGTYTVRPDGLKVDKDGYILIAAHLGRYPRCSIVETSLGLGKVYDTGGFVSRYPDGFDIATDWSNNDGR